MPHSPHIATHQTCFITMCNAYSFTDTGAYTRPAFRRHKLWCAAHLWPNPEASQVQKSTYGEPNCLSAAWMSNQTCGVSARTPLSTFHVCLVFFSPQSLQNWIGTLGLQKSPAFLTSVMIGPHWANCWHLRIEGWCVQGAKGITFLSAWNVMVIIYNRVCQESLHASKLDIFEKYKDGINHKRKQMTEKKVLHQHNAKKEKKMLLSEILKVHSHPHGHSNKHCPLWLLDDSNGKWRWSLTGWITLTLNQGGPFVKRHRVNWHIIIM